MGPLKGGMGRGVFLVALGTVLLANTTGNLSWLVWPYLLRWWPVLLVAFGLQLILRRAVFHLVLVAGLVFGVGAFVIVGPGPGWPYWWRWRWIMR